MTNAVYTTLPILHRPKETHINVHVRTYTHTSADPHANAHTCTRTV